MRILDIRGFEGPGWLEVSDAQLSVLPWSSIARIDIFDEGLAVSRGTGWLVSPCTLVTAAHVVDAWRGAAGRHEIVVEFRRLGREFRPMEIRLHDAFVAGAGEYYDPLDVAAIRIEDTGLDPLPISSPQAGSARVELAGFPRFDRWADSYVTQHGTMIRPDEDENILLYPIDSKGGHSGAPIVVDAGTSSAVAIGIHVWPFEGNPYSDRYPRHNVGLALNRPMVEFLEGCISDWG